MEFEPLRVTAMMTGGIGGHVPQLDALLVELAAHAPGSGSRGPMPTRHEPAPDPYDVPPGVGLDRAEIGGWPVYRTSAPILSSGAREGVEHFVKRIDVSRAEMLAPDRRVQVCHTNSWTKAYRLPLRKFYTPAVAWLCVGDRNRLLKLLLPVRQLGAKLRHGHGAVAEWSVEPIEDDWSWYGPGPDGKPLLMRAIPFGPWLPDNLVGYRRHFGACAPPYWHPERFAEVVVPC